MKLKTIAYAAFIAAAAGAFVIGSAGPSDAKAKKKAAAAAASPPVFCVPGENKPVCAIKGGMKFTYADACYAAKDGAKVISSKACPGPKAHKKAKAKPAKAMEKKADKKPAAKKDDKKK